MTAEFQIRNEVKSLTSFRFLAALYVFLFHVQIRVPVFGDDLFGQTIAEGAVGMTMFFTLSGFILSHAYAESKIAFNQYVQNRMARIYPVYILAAILALPWLIVQMNGEAQTSAAAYVIVGLTIIFLFGLLLIQAWLPQTFSFWNNSASWSISAEAFFYTLFPFLRDQIASFRVPALLFIFGLLCILSSMIPVSAIVFSNSPNSFSLFYALPAFRLPEFIAGIVAYHLMISIRYSAMIRRLLLLVCISGVLHVILLGDILPGYTLHNWIFIPAVCSALILLFQAEENSSGLMTSRFMVWLGSISYCFYSFQFHVLEGLKALMPIEQAGGWLYLSASFLILLSISALVHHYFEEPTRVWLRARAKRKLEMKATS